MTGKNKKMIAEIHLADSKTTFFHEQVVAFTRNTINDLFLL